MKTKTIAHALPPEDLGYLALYMCIQHELPVKNALKAAGIKVLRKPCGSRKKVTCNEAF